MSGETTTQTPEGGGEGTFTPPATQADLDKIVGTR